MKSMIRGNSSTVFVFSSAGLGSVAVSFSPVLCSWCDSCSVIILLVLSGILQRDMNDSCSPSRHRRAGMLYSCACAFSPPEWGRLGTFCAVPYHTLVTISAHVSAIAM